MYDHAVNGTTRLARDFDGAILVRSVGDLAIAVNHKRPVLKRLLAINRVECPNRPVPAVGSPGWEQIDGVRFAGFTESGLKKSVKIIAAEHFLGSRRCITLLSYKDRRVYEGLAMTGENAYQLQQATKLSSGLTILHDPWTFEGISRSYRQQ